MFASVQINTMTAMISPVVLVLSRSAGLLPLSVAFAISAISMTLIWFRWKTRSRENSLIPTVNQ